VDLLEGSHQLADLLGGRALDLAADDIRVGDDPHQIARIVDDGEFLDTRAEDDSSSVIDLHVGVGDQQIGRHDLEDQVVVPGEQQVAS